ncbi:MAG TPA: lytic transglycosylase domain-containing protein, partial [Pararhizobium sp.]|nr:lytic transglycosylase domain-containing protein [Pararhizobium sp.]
MHGHISSRLIAMLGASALSLCAFAAAAETGTIPVPKSRALALAAAQDVPFRDVTGSIPSITAAIPASSDLKTGLDALSNKDAPRAIAARNGMARGSLDSHILTWAIAVSGQKGVPSYEIARAQQELKGWPGLGRLRANSERALYRENPLPADVLSAFGTTQPETTDGTIILARALQANGRPAEAAKLLRGLWASEALDKATESKILAEFPTLLTTADHRRRMEMLLYRNRLDQAVRFSDLGKAQSLYRAWVAVSKKAGNAAALIATVDPSWHAEPAYLFIRIEYLRKQEKYEEAAKLLATLPRDKDKLVNPGEWWVEQRIISRGLLDDGKFKAAYRIAADHVAADPTDIVDAEFHAGWYALRGMEDPATAVRHFQRILKASNRPISVSRAWYWMGRAVEAGAPGNSTEYYTKAAALPGT